MITVLSGENSFEREHALKAIVVRFEGAPEKIDGSLVELRQLPDLLMGTTLFAEKRLVIIKELSSNKSVWADFADWIVRLSDEIHLVIVESKLDKRTKTYKELKKSADVREFNLYTERDAPKIEQWVMNIASEKKIVLDSQDARFLVARVGLDQWTLYRALEKLAIVDVVNQKVIEELIDPSPNESVFALLESALKGDSDSVVRILRALNLTEDPYRLFGLLSGQVFQLLALFVGDKRESEIAKDLGVHPFTLSKMSLYLKGINRTRMSVIVSAFVEADDGLKTSQAEPWLLIERALVKVIHS